MEKLSLALKASPGGQGKSGPKKRRQDTQEGREFKSRKITRTEGRKQVTLEKWLYKGEKGSGDPPRTLETGEPGRRNRNQLVLE